MCTVYGVYKQWNRNERVFKNATEQKIHNFKKKSWGLFHFLKLIESFRLNYNVSFVPNSLFATLPRYSTMLLIKNKS